MSTDIKKAILFRWIYAIFVSKEIPRSEFTDRKAVEVLNAANFNIPYNKEIKPFLNEVTNTFKEAMKNKTTLQLLAKYPMPKIVGIEESEESSPRNDEQIESNVYEESSPRNDKENKQPTHEELEESIEDIIENGDLENLTLKKIVLSLEEKYGVDLTSRKAEIDDIIEKTLNPSRQSESEPESESSSGSEDEDVPKKTTPTKKAPKKEVDQNIGRRGELKDKIKKITDEISLLRSYIAIENDFLYDMQGNANKDSLDKIQGYKNQIKTLKDTLNEVETELYSIPIPSTWDNETFGTQPEGLIGRVEEDDKKPKKKRDEMKALLKILNRPTVDGDMPDETKLNLKYVAFLSYYAISPLIAVEDPTLENTYILYPDLETSFKMSFANLSVKQRYEFIKSIFNGRSFKQINELIEKGEPLNPSESGKERSIAVSLSNFEKEPLNADDEINYNLMYYVEPNKEYSKDIMVANIVNEIKRRTKSDEDIKSKVEKGLGVVVDKASILEKVHTTQLANIKEFINKNYSSLTSQSDEEMRTIQVHYEEVRPPLRIMSEEEYQGSIPQEALLYSVSGSSEYRSDLLNIAKTMKNSTYETEIYKIKKEIESKDNIVSLDKKSERKNAELKYIKKQIEKGELSQVAGKALITFVEYYDTVSNLPSTMYEKNRMFEYKRIEDLPEQFRPAAEKEIRRRLAQLTTSHNIRLTEQKDALSKIQIEVSAPKIDIIAVADKVNNLNASEEVKNKLLTKIQKEGNINIFMTFKQLTNKMRINPLIYKGINRSKRLRKTIDEMSELDKIKSSFPKANHTINYCFTQLYLKPWLNLPKTFDYFITHPMDIEKEDMSDREKFLYGQKINAKIKGHDNLYRPTTIFWRVYCTEFLTFRDNKYNCNMNKIKSDLVNPKTRQYVLGVYNTSTKDEFRLLTEEDYNKECEWFDNSDMGSLTTFDNISVIDLNKNIRLERFARDSMKNQIKAILSLIYNAHDISLKTDNALEISAKKLENELHDAATVQGKTIFYRYVYEILNFLYLINPSSPLYPFTGFFQRLLLTSSKNNYASLVKMSKNMSEVFPEIYLIDNKQEFLEIVESKLREDTVNTIKNIRVTFEPGFKFPTQTSSSTINYNEKINNKLVSFDHSKFKNLCVNYKDVKDPFFVTEVEKQLVCIGKEDFHAIVRDDIGLTLTIPQEVVDRVKSLVKVDKSDELKRIFTMQYVADDFASSNFNILNILKNMFEEDNITTTDELNQFIDDNEDIQKAIKMVETELESKLSEKETELFINHLLSQGHNYFIQSIKSYIDTVKVDDKIKQQLINEYKKRLNLYDPDFADKYMRVDRAERLNILKDYINTLSNKYGESLTDDVKEIFVDYFHTRHILPLVKDVKQEKIESSGNPLYIPHCNVCDKRPSKQSDVIRTYLFKDGKKVLSEFCSTKCMEKVSEKEFEVPKDIKEITLHGLIDKIIVPLNLTFDELIHRTKLIGMTLPENISFNQAYISWLSNSSFADSIWLNYHHETLDKIAKHYNIREDDVQKLWKELTTKADFNKLFHGKLEEIAKPYSKYRFDKAEQDIYSPDCNYPKVAVEKWLSDIAKSLLPEDWINHSFNTFNFDSEVFVPFFRDFNRCSNIIETVKARKDAKINRKFLTDIVMVVGKYHPKQDNKLEKRIVKTAQKLGLGKDIIERSKNLLYDKLNIKTSAQPLENVIYKRMNETYGDQYPLTVLALEFNLDINDSNVSVELYRDLLLQVGLDFINKYIRLMSSVKEGSVEVSKKKGKKGKKLPADYKDLLDTENELLALKEKSAEISNKILAIGKSIKDKKKELKASSIEEYGRESAGKWSPESLQKELDELGKSYTDAQSEQLEIDFSIQDLETTLSEKQEKYNEKHKTTAPVAVQKKGVFRKTKEIAIEKSEMHPTERREQIENTLKYNLFNAISARLPENFNLYNVAEILGLNEKGSIFATDVVLTAKMIKEGKKSLDVGDMEEEFKPTLEDEEERVDEDNYYNEPEGLDKENLEEYVVDEDGNEDNLEDEGAEYGAEPEDDDYSY